MSDTLPPNDFSLEQAAIGSMLIDPSVAIPKALAAFTPGAEVFYDLRNSTCYSAIVSQFNEGGALDLASIKSALSREFPKVDWLQYLSDLMSAAPMGFYIEKVAPQLISLYVRRKMISVCTEAVLRAEAHKGDVDSMLDEIEQSVLSVRVGLKSSRYKPIRELVQDAIGEFEAAFNRQGEISGIRSGYVDLDVIMDGLQPAELTIIAAFPGHGKSTLSMNIAEFAAINHKIPVGVFTLEMSSVSMVKRMLCSNAKVNMHDVRMGRMADFTFPKLTGSAGRISKAPIHLDETSDMSIGQLRAKARRMWQQHGVRLFIVDYIQLMSASGEKDANREREVSAIAMGLKQMAKELNAHVIAPSQLNDDGKLRESRAIGQHADNVLMLETNGEMKSGVQPMKLWVNKHRNGASGICVDLTFMKQYTRFESAAKVTNGDIPHEH